MLLFTLDSLYALWFIDHSYMEMDVYQVSIPDSPPDITLY